MSDIARHIRVSGRVQGVGFRHYTKLKARELGVRGHVRNLPDGSVEVWAEGASPAVAALIEWLAHGPPAADVEATHVRDTEPRGAEKFEVQREV
jgi:acylphosphatase